MAAIVVALAGTGAGADGDTTPPVIDSVVNPAAPDGSNGWYRSDVAVTLTPHDDESAITSQSSGCGTTAITSDTQGTTVTCEATSAGGTNSASVTIRRDTTAPTVTCETPLPTFTYGEPGARARVRAQVSDGVSGPTTSVATAGADTSSLGFFNVAVTGRDNAGNETTKSCLYAVRHSRVVSVSDVWTAEPDSGTTTATFAVSLSSAPPSGQTTTVKVATANGTATAGTDYVKVPSTTLTWSATDPLTKNVGVTVSGDVLHEGNETFSLALSAPANATLADNSASATIVDNEGPFFVSVADTAVTEGNAGTKAMNFTLSLSTPPATGESVTVQLNTANGTATAGSDYSATTTTKTFTAGQQTRTVGVTITGDTTTEANETLTATLSAPSTNAVIADPTATGTVINDDPVAGAPPTRTVSVSDVWAAEPQTGAATATFAVSLSAAPPSGQTTTVKVATVNGTATAGADYNGVPLTTLTWTATDPLIKTVAVTVNGDVFHEGNETFSLALSAPTNATLADNGAAATIVDDEGPFFVSVADAGVTEGNAGSKAMNFTLSLSAAPATGESTTVTLNTTNGTATAGSDYSATTTTRTFTAGQQTRTVAVTITGDTTTEANETFTPTLGAPSPNTVMADPTATGTIVNDDYAASRPNVLFLLVDDLDATTTSYWDALPQTKALIADRGLVFTNHFAPDPLCCPARSSILTGRYPHNTGVFDNSAPDGGYQAFFRSAENDTVATRLHDNGYRTALMGKYLNGYELNPGRIAPGWDEWFAFNDVHQYEGYGYTVNHNGATESFGSAEADYSTDVLTSQAVTFIDGSEANDARPWFLYLTPTAPHLPLEPPARYAENQFDDDPVPPRPNYNEADVSDKATWLRDGTAPISGALSDFNVADYRNRLGSLMAVDDMVVALVDELQDDGELDNTLIVFASDNGYNLGAHRLVAKSAPYEESIRVPMAIAGPGIPAGTEQRLVIQEDLAPTILQLAHVPNDDVDGRSLVPLFDGTAQAWRDDFLLEYHGTYTSTAPFDNLADVQSAIAAGQTPLVPTFRGIRQSTMVYIEWYRDEPHEYELYDLSTDPYQLENLVATPEGAAQYAAVTAAMHARLETLAMCGGPTCRD